jgi:hypothetical protein
MDSAPPGPPASAGQLPPEAIALAGRLFEAARKGQMDIFEQALPKGLSPNMTNEKGDSLVGIFLPLAFLSVERLQSGSFISLLNCSSTSTRTLVPTLDASRLHN